ncbi:hypothetical protein AJ79_08827 [Helicocarpus griseus UAMH5409]|uniref:Zn(2)-C6 fungal-type domain-containing protein n=1 Tax=Helicocarpus griseus UAMH5409 TaxID=1447875 RepID=A0A2B7WPK7_9EURO|nr:hypothetical protein AJ79_08827 [Helicocarpus griseus UAMH5409]
MTDSDSARIAATSFTNRKPHTKSRTGCFNCKARRVKCPENHPVCETCVARKQVCIYPQQKISQRQKQISRRLEPSHSNSKDNAAVSRFADSSSSSATPTYALQHFPSFTMEDMRFFHHYMIAAHPYLPFGCDEAWLAEIPLLAHQHPYLMHALLSLGASHLSLLSSEVSPYYAATVSHRGLALRGLKQSMIKHANSPLPTNTDTESIHGLNAMLATSYALTIQSTYMADGFTDFLVLVRGCTHLSENVMQATADHSSLPLSVNDCDQNALCARLMTDNGGEDIVVIDMPSVSRLAISTQALTPALHHDWEREYHSLLMSALAALQRRDWLGAFGSFQQIYGVWSAMGMDEACFREQVASTAAGGDNTTFLILFTHFTALQLVMLPIVYRALPARARWPRLLWPQFRWLVDITWLVPVGSRGMLVGALEVVKILGGMYGVFVGKEGKGVLERLNERLEDMKRTTGLLMGVQ